MTTKPEFLVTKEKMLVALATVSVAILSPELQETTQFFQKYNIIIFIKGIT